MTWTLALRNLLRQRVRTCITLLAIVVGVASLILSGGFVRDIIRQLGEAVIGSQTGHLQLAHPRYFDGGQGLSADTLLHNAASLRKQVALQPEVADAMGRLSFSGLLNNGQRDHAIVGEGIEPGPEARLGGYVQIIAGRALAERDGEVAIVGEGLAQSMDLHPGDVLTLLVNTPEGAINTADIEIVGIFRSFSKDFDARAVRVPLGTAQDLLATDAINTLVLRLHDTQQTDAAYRALQPTLDGPALSVRRWETLSDFYHKAVALYDRQFGTLQAIILLMVLLSVSNSVNMSAFERIAEFGTLRALGSRRAELIRLLLAENLVLGVLGASLGVAIGLALAEGISAIGIPMPPPPGSNVAYTAYIRPSLATVAEAWTIGFAATLVAALLPALRLTRIPLVDALRRAI